MNKIYMQIYLRRMQISACVKSWSNPENMVKLIKT